MFTALLTLYEKLNTKCNYEQYIEWRGIIIIRWITTEYTHVSRHTDYWWRLIMTTKCEYFMHLELFQFCRFINKDFNLILSFQLNIQSWVIIMIIRIHHRCHCKCTHNTKRMLYWIVHLLKLIMHYVRVFEK